MKNLSLPHNSCYEYFHLKEKGSLGNFERLIQIRPNVLFHKMIITEVTVVNKPEQKHGIQRGSKNCCLQMFTPV